MTSTDSLLSTATTTSTVANPLISSSATGSGSASSSSSTLSSLNYNFNEFLTLFTTQLKNQDPTKPMDTTEMTNQLALFSNVEQTAGVNSRLDKLLAAQTSTGIGSAVSYIGKTVESTGNQISLSGGTAEIAYTMPSAGQSVRIDIRDTNGGLISTLAGDPSSGDHQLTWNGTDSSGSQVSDGAYTVSVTATDSSGGATITPTTKTTGKVTGVETSGTDTLLDLGKIQVKMSDVTAVRA